MAHEVDIRALTDELEKGNGCRVKGQLQEFRFDEQVKVFDEIWAEAASRPNNSLSFEKRSVEVTLPNGTPTGEVIPVLHIEKDGQMIFEAFKPPGQDAVFGACKGNFADAPKEQSKK